MVVILGIAFLFIGGGCERKYSTVSLNEAYLTEEKTTLQFAVEAHMAVYEELTKEELSEQERSFLTKEVTLTSEAAKKVAASETGEIAYAYRDLFGVEETYEAYEKQADSYDGEVIPLNLGNGK